MRSLWLASAFVLVAVGTAEAQIFDRQLTATDNFSDDGGGSSEKIQAFRQFVGRNAFTGGSVLPIGGFFGCNGQGGGECNRTPVAKQAGQEAAQSGGGSAENSFSGSSDDGGSGSHCP